MLHVIWELNHSNVVIPQSKISRINIRDLFEFSVCESSKENTGIQYRCDKPSGISSAD